MSQHMVLNLPPLNQFIFLLISSIIFKKKKTIQRIQILHRVHRGIVLKFHRLPYANSGFFFSYEYFARAETITPYFRYPKTVYYPVIVFRGGLLRNANGNNVF